jgi:hypothetical protein
MQVPLAPNLLTLSNPLYDGGARDAWRSIIWSMSCPKASKAGDRCEAGRYGAER